MSDSCAALWSTFLASGLEAASSAEGATYDSWQFGYGVEQGDRLLAVVMTGPKRATAGALAAYEHEGEAVPQPGDFSIVTDGSGVAGCIIRTTRVDVTPFDQVDEQFAFDEGEGDRSLEYWRSVHWPYFVRELESMGQQATPDMLVVCERFEVVYPPLPLREDRLPGFEIRAESPADVGAIRTINIEAFRDHPISQQTEHLIVDALRESGALEVSLVAVVQGRTVGHVAFSEAVVGDLGSGWFLLGPIAVMPGVQHRGIGSALVESGLAELKARNAAGCVLVGDPAFYSRFGFSEHPGLDYEGVPHEYVLGLPISGCAPCGVIRANEAFEIEPDSSERSAG